MKYATSCRPISPHTDGPCIGTVGGAESCWRSAQSTLQFTVSALDVFSTHGNLLCSQMELSYRLWALRVHPSITRLNYSFLSN